MKNHIPESLPDPRAIAVESLNTQRLSAVLGLEEKQSRRPHPIMMAAAGAVLTAGSFTGLNYLTDTEVETAQPSVALEQEVSTMKITTPRPIEDDNQPRRTMIFPAPVIPSPTAIPVVPSPAPVVEAAAPVPAAAPPKPAPAPPKPVVQPKPVAPAYPSNSTYGKAITTKVTNEMLQTGVPYWVKKQTGDHMDDVTLRASSGMSPGQPFTENQTIRYRDCDQGKQMTVKAGTSASRIVQELNKHNWPITMDQLVEWNGGKNGLRIVAGYCIRIAK